MLLGTLKASLLGNPLTGKGVKNTGKKSKIKGRGVLTNGEGTVRADQDF